MIPQLPRMQGATEESCCVIQVVILQREQALTTSSVI